MYALDFEYDGQYLSDYGFIICNFDGSSGMETVSAGSSVTFNKVARHSGKKYGLTSTQYDECIEATFCIGKDPAVYGKDNMQITNDEYRDLMRWLNRREFLKFQLLGGDDYDGETCYYEASFNIGKIKIAEVLYGMELTMETNKPFGYGQEQSITWNVSDPTKSSNTDPTALSTASVKRGDIWINTGNQEIGYYYIPADEKNKHYFYGGNDNIVASDGGLWLRAQYWWERSPTAGSSTHFVYVYYYGYPSSTSNATGTIAVVPCFSI